MADLDTAYMITTLVTMFVVMDPIAIAPLFIALTPGMSQADRVRIVWRTCAVAGGVLLLFILTGEALLAFIGISMPAFRVAGGILLFITALDMLFERRTKRREDQSEAEDHPDPSVFPLAIPLIAGPGAIASVILLSAQKPGAEGVLTVGVITAFVLAIMGLVLALSTRLERVMGKTAITVTTRLLGMLLAALSVQFVLDGLTAFGFGPGSAG